MTETRSIINAATGEHERVEYYTHDEFMEQKRARLEHIKARAKQMATVDVSNLSQLERAMRLVEVVGLVAEWKRVSAATGNMIVGKNTNESM